MNGESLHSNDMEISDRYWSRALRSNLSGQRRLQFRPNRVFPLKPEGLRRRVSPALWSIAYGILLSLIYRGLIANYFGLGYGLEPVDFFTNTFALIATGWIACILPRTAERPSDWLFWVLFLLCVVPILFVFPMVDDLGAFTHITFMACVVASLRLALFIAHLPNFARSRPSDFRWKVPSSVSVLLSFIILAGLFAFAGPPGFVGFDDVYVQRAAFSTTVARLPGYGYFLSWIASAVAPTLIAVGFLRRRRALFLCGCGLLLFLFGYTAEKAHVFAVPYLVGLGFVVRSSFRKRKFKNPGVPLAIAFSLLCGFSSVYDLSTGGRVGTTYVTRRTFAAAGFMSSAYVRVMEHRPKANFADTIPLGIVRSGLSEPSTRLVAREGFGFPAGHANANLWADGFANGGFLAVVLIGVPLGVLFALVDRRSAQFKGAAEVSALSFALHMITISNTGLPTTFLGHGFVISLILIGIGQRPAGRSAKEANSSRRAKRAERIHV
jgi:hypothetical protein